MKVKLDRSHQSSILNFKLTLTEKYVIFRFFICQFNLDRSQVSASIPVLCFPSFQISPVRSEKIIVWESSREKFYWVPNTPYCSPGQRWPIPTVDPKMIRCESEKELIHVHMYTCNTCTINWQMCILRCDIT